MLVALSNDTDNQLLMLTCSYMFRTEIFTDILSIDSDENKTITDVALSLEMFIEVLSLQM